MYIYSQVILLEFMIKIIQYTYIVATEIVNGAIRNQTFEGSLVINLNLVLRNNLLVFCNEFLAETE